MALAATLPASSQSSSSSHPPPTGGRGSSILTHLLSPLRSRTLESRRLHGLVSTHLGEQGTAELGVLGGCGLGLLGQPWTSSTRAWNCQELALETRQSPVVTMSTEWNRRRVCVDPVNGMVASDPGERLETSNSSTKGPAPGLTCLTASTGEE
ncbi:hypothetical protein B0T20DRAFT_399944 [Sordaria brevicollis]|uniref:Uncharacterized protein n=1 Tax=Sordaria brevicollis TaxID=83679 RepID=A0AAE0UG97_SORBR|nr:hypothetical protein B0T20DRAFT_399944 [Sordaria brevicollis]